MKRDFWAGVRWVLWQGCLWSALATMGTMMALAQPVRLHFLQTPEIIEETIRHLAEAGCSDEALAGFRFFATLEMGRWRRGEGKSGAAEDYVGFGAVEDIDAFEPPTFSGLLERTSVQRHHSLMCFDLALLILRNGPVSADRVSASFGQKHFVALSARTRGGLTRLNARPAQQEDFRHGQSLLSSPLAYRRFTGFESRSAGEENLAVSLRAARSIPGHYASSEAVVRRLFEQRAALWRDDGVVFSERIQIVLAQFVSFQGRFIGSDHIGLAVKTPWGWMYFEKNGTTNPMVRLDCPTLADIATFILNQFAEDRYDARLPLHNAAFILSANDRILRVDLRQNPRLHLKSLIRSQSSIE